MQLTYLDGDVFVGTSAEEGENIRHKSNSGRL